MISTRRGGPFPCLEGRTIVLTRALADNELLASRLTELGAQVEQIPLNLVVPAPDGGAALAERLNRVTDYRWVVLTSGNGVRALVDGWGAVPWPDSVFVAVVGEATAEIADAAGLPVHFIASEATSASLVADFPRAVVPAGQSRIRVLAPLAELASSTVEEGLAAKGYEVDRLVAYATICPPVDKVLEPAQRALVHSADLAVLSAPSAASRFVERFSVDHEGKLVPPCVPVACIGPVTARRASTLGLNVAAVASPHNDHGLVDAVIWALTDQVG